jgi:uncharacterized protein YgbK (DUF1537 family)
MEGRVVVLDDDPTGTQCAADVTVALDLDPAALAAHDDRSLYVLTNTRAVNAVEARRIVREVRRACSARHPATSFVLRGDSTLRGHVKVEMAALGLAQGVGLIVPAYPAAGRITFGGVHYLETAGRRVNVADTEFARDPVFGFRSRTLQAWAREVGLAGGVVAVTLDQLHAGAAATELLSAPDGAVVVCDAVTDNDIALLAEAYRQVRAAGRWVVVRSAAPLAAAIAGTPGRRLLPVAAPANRLLVVCGSHTAAATRQLAAFSGARRVVHTLPTAELLASKRRRDRCVLEFQEAARVDLERQGVAIVATERVRRSEHATLDEAAQVMTGLVRIVGALADDVDAVVSKGGITSAEVARTGLSGSTARVRGQIATGISLWDVTAQGGRTTPQAVIPGNIGEDSTLIDVCRFFGVR